MELTSILLLSTVSAGYGVPVDGYPSHDERQLLLWTNAARVAPDAFGTEYTNGGCSTDDFSEDELTPKAPLYVDLGLTEASRYHSVTMEENGCFQHDSCDGSGESFDQRVAHYYTDSGYVGENIAMGGVDERYSVMSMWMCSHDGHRANIMAGDYNEMGPGVSGSYMTQDFAAGNLNEGDPPVRMAVDDGDAWWADWGDTAAPEGLELVIDGVQSDFALQYGTAEQGIYSITPAVSSTTCKAWYAWWQTADGDEGTFPQEGSFLAGADCGNGDDWTSEQAPRGGLFGDVDKDDLEAEMLEDISLVGCTTTPGAAGLAAIGLALVAVSRRKR